jgi:hypothetical protein
MAVTKPGSKLFVGGDDFRIPNYNPGVQTGFDYFPEIGLYDPTPIINTGVFTDHRPGTGQTYPNRPGTRLATFFNDYYNQVHVLPSAISFGAIVDTTSVEIYIWNAYYGQSIQLTSIVLGDFGVSIAGADLPATFPPLQDKIYTAVATTEGPATFNEQIEWHFDVPTMVKTRMDGVRSELYRYPPAWPPTGRGYRIEYSYHTEVTASRSGKEQRTAWRTSPRKSIDFTAVAHGDRLNDIKTMHRTWQHRNFVLPEITASVRTRDVVLPGSDYIELESIPHWLVAESLIVIGGPDGMEVMRVLTIDQDGIAVTTVGLSPNLKPAGTKVYPGLSGYMTPRNSFQFHTSDTAVGQVGFDVVPLSEVQPEPVAPAVTLDGREVWLKKPNWANQPRVTYRHEVDNLDFDRGPVYRYAATAFGTEEKQLTFVNRNRAEAAEIRDFFMRMKGRQGEFYMPTWEPDFEPMQPSFANSSAIRVAGSRFANSYGGDTVYRALYILMNDGSILVRRVLGVEVVNDFVGLDSVITVDTPFPVEVSTDTVTVCGWMPVWRLVSDNLTIEWLTDEVAQVRLTMMTLEDLTPE